MREEAAHPEDADPAEGRSNAALRETCMEVQTEFPDGWLQLAQPSRWDGLHINHLVAPSYEGEFQTSTVIVSFIKKAARTSEAPSISGRWKELGITSGTICSLPFHYGDRIRTEGNVEAINLFVDFSWLKSRLNDSLNLLDRPLYGMHDKVSQCLMEDIYKDNQAGTPNGLVYSESLALALLHRLNAKSLQRPVDIRVQREQRVIGLAIDYIHANLHESLALADIVRAAGYEGDLFAFLRLLRRYTGKPPHRYILDIRLEVAKKMLLGGKHTVTDVALSCGFGNMSHFSTAFKRHWGVTPSAVLRSPTQASV